MTKTTKTKTTATDYEPAGYRPADPTGATMPRYEGNVPKTLRAWIDKHCVGKVYEVTRSGGFSFDDGMGYDVGIVAGWCVDAGGDRMHTVIEHSIKDVISVLKTLAPCHDDDECRAAWAARSKGGR